MPENFEHQNALLDHLYATIEDPAQWNEALPHLRHLLHAQCCLLASYNMATGLADLIVQCGLAEVHRRSYERRFAGQGPWLQAGDELLVSGAVVTATAVIADVAMRRSPFYLDWLQPQGLLHGVTAVFGREGHWLVYAQGFRREADGPFGPGELETCHWAAGHLGRLLRVRRAVLQALHRGARVSLRATGRSLALPVLADASTLPSVAGADPDTVASALRLVQRPIERRQALTRPRTGGGARVEALRRRFGLTLAEARVAVLLSRGRSVSEIAATLDVATTTVRTHLRQIFAKTNTRRQSELLMLLLNAESEAAPLVLSS